LKDGHNSYWQLNASAHGPPSGERQVAPPSQPATSRIRDSAWLSTAKLRGQQIQPSRTGQHNFVSSKSHKYCTTTATACLSLLSMQKCRAPIINKKRTICAHCAHTKVTSAHRQTGVITPRSGTSRRNCAPAGSFATWASIPADLHHQQRSQVRARASAWHLRGLSRRDSKSHSTSKCV